MLKIEKFVTASPEQWEIVIEGMRNPKNSWDRMDSSECMDWGECGHGCDCFGSCYNIGPNDHELMMNLANGGSVHAKYRRMIPVWVTINAPLYWWKEFDTYKVGTTANSCSTMHKIHSKEFTLKDFSYEHLEGRACNTLEDVIDDLNHYREYYLSMISQKVPGAAAKAKDIWWQMIQLLPTSYNQKRTVFLNYEVLYNIYIWRRHHKLDEWHVFCDWIESLPYSELITGDANGNEEA